MIEAIVSAAGVDTTTVTIRLGAPHPTEAGAMDRPVVTTQGKLANVPELTAMAGSAGWMDPEGQEDVFPHAERMLGAHRVRAIALTARILAAGGARVIVTYALGRSDANALIDEINGFVGSPIASALRYDMMDGAVPLVDGVTHLYHFASPRIYRQKAALFDAGVFAEFTRAYLGSFHDLCCALPGLRVAFYPSSVFVEPGRPRDMTEYAMIKAAGEILCAEMNATEGFPMVVSRRLPRMLTDQTATLARVATDDALTTMLPVVRDVQAATSGVPA